MDIVKAAVDWAKAEIVSAKFFASFGVLFLLCSTAFWQFGKSEFAQALIYPISTAGALLIAAGIGFYYSNNKRLANFASDYKANSTSFIESEIERTTKTIKSYENIAFKVFPIIILLATFMIYFIDSPFWRAVNVAIFGFFAVTIFLDWEAHRRTKIYHEQLKLVKKEGK